MKKSPNDRYRIVDPRGHRLPALAGPAILVGAYTLALRIGHWRTERKIERMTE